MKISAARCLVEKYFLGLVLAFSACAPAVSASFDCSAKLMHIETVICQNEVASALDSRLAIVYANVMKKFPGNSQEIRQSQRQWLREVRNSCRDEICVIATYQERVSYLEYLLTHSSLASEFSSGTSAVSPTRREPQRPVAHTSGENGWVAYIVVIGGIVLAAWMVKRVFAWLFSLFRRPRKYEFEEPLGRQKDYGVDVRGMTADQLRELHGEPFDIKRSASNGVREEKWRYHPMNSGYRTFRLTVVLKNGVVWSYREN